MERKQNSEKGQRTKEKILQTALELFAKKGYHATTMRDIASAADVTPGLYYRYFASKNEILEGIIVSHGNFMEKIGDFLVGKPGVVDKRTLAAALKFHDKELRLYFQLVLQKDEEYDKLSKKHLPDLSHIVLQINQKEQQDWLATIGIMFLYIFSKNDTFLKMLEEDVKPKKPKDK